MLAPMRARLASSCSTKGISAVDTETICFGETSIRSTSDGGTKSISDVVPYDPPTAPTRTPVPCGPRRTRTRSSVRRPSASDRRVGLGDDVLLLLVGGQVAHLVGDLAVLDGAVGRLDEAVLVDPGVGGQGADQADVRALGRLDRAHAPVVGGVDVSHLEAGAAHARGRRGPRAERRRLWARPDSGLFWSMNWLSCEVPKNSLTAATTGTDVDQRLGRDGLDVLGGHALAHHPLHAREPDADLVLDQLAHRADAPVGEVVLVVDPVGRLAVGHVQGQVQHVGGRGQDLRGAQHALVGRRASRCSIPKSSDSRSISGPSLRLSL